MLDLSVKLVRRTAKRYIVWLFLAALPFQAAIAYAARNQPTNLVNLLNLTSSGQRPAANDVLIEYAALVGLYVTFPVATAFLCRRIALAYAGQPFSPWRGWPAARAMVVLMVASLVAHLVELVSLFVFLLPALVFMTYFSLAAPAVVVEGKGPFAALARSWWLVRGRLFAVLGMSLLAGWLATLVGRLATLLPEVLAQLTPHRLASVLQAFSACLSLSLEWWLMASFVTLLYISQRLRREGLDLKAMAAGLGASAG